jgi:hypothetical protein
MTSKQLAVYKNGDFAYGYFDEDKRRDGRVIYQSQKGTECFTQAHNTMVSLTEMSGKGRERSFSTEPTNSQATTMRTPRLASADSTVPRAFWKVLFDLSQETSLTVN